MKSILKVLSIFALGMTSSLPAIANLNFFNQDQKNNNSKAYDIIFRKILDNFFIFKQISDNYCGPATVQSVLNFLLHSSPSQQELAQRLGTDNEGGTRPSAVTSVLNSFIDRFDYEHNLISRNFGAVEADMIMFQDAATYSLVHDIPPILVFNGQLPWAPSITEAHVVPITGIEVDDDPALTRYQIAEASIGEGEFRWFTGSDLRNMFTNGNGSLVLSTNRFNFWESRITIPTNGNSNEGAIHEQIPGDGELTATSTASLLYEAGISSITNLQKAKSLALPNFSLHYLWNKHTYDNATNETWTPSEFKEDMGWIIADNQSISWDDDDEGEAKIDMLINQTLSVDMRLTLMYKVEGKKTGPRPMPYVDLNTGYYWYFTYKD